jgi:hypothetical protein
MLESAALRFPAMKVVFSAYIFSLFYKLLESRIILFV